MTTNAWPWPAPSLWTPLALQLPADAHDTEWIFAAAAATGKEHCLIIGSPSLILNRMPPATTHQLPQACDSVRGVQCGHGGDWGAGDGEATKGGGGQPRVETGVVARAPWRTSGSTALAVSAKPVSREFADAAKITP